MPDEVMRAIADVFVDAIARLELDPARTTTTRHAGVRYFLHPDGREGSAITHEFFPYALPAEEAIRLARSLAQDAPHLITPLGGRIEADAATYENCGYRRTNSWTVMTHPLTHPLTQPGDERVLAITDPETEARVMRAVLPDGGTGHPTRTGHAADAAIRQRWIEDGGEPAAFGRLVQLGDFAYLGDMVTVPAYRRRGHAAAIARRLLDDALTAGATTCVLVSTPMGLPLYQKFGFTDVMSLVEYRSHGA
jgi:GNAT superfamily N-acetyltransferase